MSNFLRLAVGTSLLGVVLAVEPQPRTIPTAQNLQAMVPATGKLGERELTLLALAKRPQLERLRGLVKVANAQQLAAHDLPNPELRLSYAYDDDALLRQPYTESETFTTRSAGNYDLFDSTSTLNGPTQNAERGNISENRTRTIERHITPGRNQDVIEERVYETDNTITSTSRDHTRQGVTTPEFERQSERRRLLTTNRRVINHPDPRTEDTGVGALMRFTLPHPWERKARIQRAAAEVSLAEADYFAEEDLVVRTVRASYQQLAILEAKLATHQKRRAAYDAFREWLEKQQSPRLGLDLASARAKAYSSLADIRSLENEITATRQDLAAYCGVTDPNRISATVTSRRIGDPLKLDVPYLSGVAMLYRSDLLGTKARLAVAQAQLKEAKAVSIPFTTFLDLGYTHETTTHRAGDSNEFSARIGFSIPLFDWTGFNKKREVPKAAALSLEQQIQMQHSLITNEVSQALKRLSTADGQLSTCDKDLVALKADLKKSLTDAQVGSTDVADVVKAKRIEQEFIDIAGQMELSRYTALGTYQDALMALEKALGTRIEQVLRPGVEAR